MTDYFKDQLGVHTPSTVPKYLHSSVSAWHSERLAACLSAWVPVVDRYCQHDDIPHLCDFCRALNRKNVP